jgi:hypothetical protein
MKPAAGHDGHVESLQTIVPERPSIAARCSAFDAKNPEVYAEFRQTSFAWFAAGLRGFSATTVLEVIRFEHAKKGARLVYNADYVAPWTRKLIGEDAKFAQVFRPRTLRPRRDAGA